MGIETIGDAVRSGTDCGVVGRGTALRTSGVVELLLSWEWEGALAIVLPEELPHPRRLKLHRDGCAFLQLLAHHRATFLARLNDVFVDRCRLEPVPVAEVP